MSDYPTVSTGAPGTPEIRVVDVYVYHLRDHSPRFLLLRRAAGTIYDGAWRMVAGKIARNETAWAAALRELAEETGLGPKSLWAVPSVNSFYEWKHDRINVIPVFAAEVDPVDPVLDHEHDRFGWFDVDEAASRLTWPEQSRLVRLVADMLGRPIPPELIIPTDSR